MGIAVLVLGKSGSGKSSSLRGFKSDELCIYNVAGKIFPFRNTFRKVFQNPSITDIINSLKAPKGGKHSKVYVIDDSQYLMAFESFRRAKEVGYGKFTDIAVSFYNLIQTVIRDTPPDTIVYFLHHSETTDSGEIKAKTIGKMLDNQLTVEGLFPIVLLCQTDGKRHYFVTQSDGYSTAKSPMDMFPTEIDNDLKDVDLTIREYFGLNAQQAENPAA